MIEDLRCISRVGACHHSDGVAAHGGNGGYVACQPASAAGVAGVDNQNAGGAGFIRWITVQFIGIGREGGVHGHDPVPAPMVA